MAETVTYVGGVLSWTAGSVISVGGDQLITVELHLAVVLVPG